MPLIRSTNTAKLAVRKAIAGPGVRHALRWVIQHKLLPRRWRELAHRKVAKRAHFGGASFTYTTPSGTSLRLVNEGAGNYLFWLDEYEPEATSLFSALAAQAPAILDIGAAQGIYALYAAAANPAARVLAFEPGEDAAKTCARNFALNRAIARNVELQVLALGEHNARTTLYVAGESGGTSSLDPSFRRTHREQHVTVRNGDELLAELGVPRVGLIKVDTETTEPAVLRGLLRTLKSDHPDLVCEVLHGRTERELEAVLRPLGYRFFWISETGLVASDHLRGDPTYRHPNYLFTVRSDVELAGLGARIRVERPGVDHAD